MSINDFYDLAVGIGWVALAICLPFVTVAYVKNTWDRRNSYKKVSVSSGLTGSQVTVSGLPVKEAVTMINEHLNR